MSLTRRVGLCRLDLVLEEGLSGSYISDSQSIVALVCLSAQQHDFKVRTEAAQFSLAFKELISKMLKVQYSVEDLPSCEYKCFTRRGENFGPSHILTSITTTAPSQAPECPMLFQKFVWRSHFHQLPRIQHNNSIRVHNCVQPMSNSQHGVVTKLCSNESLHQQICF